MFDKTSRHTGFARGCFTNTVVSHSLGDDLPKFDYTTRAYQGLPGPTSVYQCLPASTMAYQGLPVPTRAYQCLPGNTSVYQGLPGPTKAYQGPPVPTRASQDFG